MSALARVLAVALAALLLAAAARPADVAGWGAARWGMTAGELGDAFAGRLEALPGRWEYGGAYAELALPEVAYGGVRFLAHFQMNAGTGRLQQVLLQAGRATPAGFTGLLDALKGDYGAPDLVCEEPLNRRDPMRLEYVWRFPTTTIHATFLDFDTDSVFSEDPNRPHDPRRPRYERRRNLDLPRRVLLRFHPSGRADLMGRDGCRAAPGAP